jgi:hypothetical protein
MGEYALQGYVGGVQTLSDKKVVVTQHTGPASYTQITPGTQPAQPTGGDSISAQACGLKYIEAVMVCGDSSGKYGGYAFNPPVNTSGNPSGQGAAATKVPLQWIVSATGAEVAGAVNLSTFQLTLVVIGF